MILLLVVVFMGQARQNDFPALPGPYLGQKPPEMTPEKFAPGIVTTAAFEYALELSANGNEILFARDTAIMLAVRDAKGIWKLPAIASFSGKYVDGEPCFSPDGQTIFFSSRRPHARAVLSSNIWVVAKAGAGWGIPVLFDKLPWAKTIHALSVAANGNIYEDGIIRFKKVGETYQAAEHLSPAVKGMVPFVAPDESYIVLSVWRPGRRDADLFISYQHTDRSWSRPVSLGDTINSEANEGNPFVTADGRYLFFSRGGDIYWVSAKIIKELRPKEEI